MCAKMATIMLALCVISIASLRSCLSDDGHEMEEFLKREYSLSKPYQGRKKCPVHAMRPSHFIELLLYLHIL